MKKTIALLTLLLMVTLPLATPAHAEESQYNGMAYKLGRGVSNLILSPMEIAMSVDEHVNDYGFTAGIPIGFFHGLGRGVARAATAAYDIATFLAPTPTYDSYHMEPEFVLAGSKLG